MGEGPVVDALDDDSLLRDLILLGMKPTTTEQQVGSCFYYFAIVSYYCSFTSPGEAIFHGEGSQPGTLPDEEEQRQSGGVVEEEL